MLLCASQPTTAKAALPPDGNLSKVLSKVQSSKSSMTKCEYPSFTPTFLRQGNYVFLKAFIILMLARSHGFPQKSLKHFMNDIVFYYVYDMIFFDNLPNDFFFFSFLRFVFIFVGSASFGCGQFHGQTGHK